MDRCPSLFIGFYSAYLSFASLHCVASLLQLPPKTVMNEYQVYFSLVLGYFGKGIQEAWHSLPLAWVRRLHLDDLTHGFLVLLSEVSVNVRGKQVLLQMIFRRMTLQLLCIPLPKDLLVVGKKQDVIIAFNATWGWQFFARDVRYRSTKPQLNLFVVVVLDCVFVTSVLANGMNALGNSILDLL